ncbi:MAG: DUF2974 domain-containing protein, partial [Lachnospiraceae bacterium]|nr:DUF2974 domain-containing protein [Lachnospiraceae bacterium]
DCCLHWDDKANRAFFQAVCESKRFGSVCTNHYCEIVETNPAVQFCAVTFLLPNQTLFVAFRGTDESLVGWKEALDLAGFDSTPGQRYAVAYLEEIIDKYKRPCTVGGHSKGGNFALYAGLNAKRSCQEQIRRIYCLDGPDLRKTMESTVADKGIASKVIKIVPQNAVIGRLFDQKGKFLVVHAKGNGLARHGLLSWQVRDTDLVISQKNHHLVKTQVCNRWLQRQNDKQYQLFTEYIYRMVRATQVETVRDLFHEWRKNVRKMRRFFKRADNTQKEVFQNAKKTLVACLKEQYFPRRSMDERDWISSTK